MLRYVLVALACACLLARSCTCAKEAKGLAFDTASALCNTATVLAGISAAAESAAADMKRRRGFLSSWRRVASEVSEETQNLTVAGEAEKLARVAEGMGDIEHEALAVAGDRGTHKRAPDRLRQALRDILRRVNGGGKTCIGKATGSVKMPQRRTVPQTTSTPPGVRRFTAGHGNNESAHHPAWYRTCAGGHTNDKGRHSQRPGPTARAHCIGNGRQHRRRREGCPLAMHRSHKSVGIAGVIEAANNGGTARKVDWAGLIEMTPSSTSTNSGTNADAAQRWNGKMTR
ncbi:hypothetical protein ERJ75_001567800 [Trypanosoma vivax]|nr:hypothetical protein ERJ75_001567800 [Trypanosoma vivax]